VAALIVLGIVVAVVVLAAWTIVGATGPGGRPTAKAKP
jgi:hypothetical protein